MRTFLTALWSYRQSIFAGLVAADAYARGRNWQEPVYIGAALVFGGAILGLDHARTVLQARRLARRLTTRE